MSLDLNLEEIFRLKKIEEKFECEFFPYSLKISPGFLVERALIETLNDSDYFSNSFIIPSFFSKSLMGGYEFKLNNKVLFEVDDIKLIEKTLTYLEVKSGVIPNSYLDRNYKSKRDKYGTNVDVRKIFSLSDRVSLFPNLIIFYNKDLLKNSRLLKRVQNNYYGRIHRVGFNFDYKYACEVVGRHNKRAMEFR